MTFFVIPTKAKGRVEESPCTRQTKGTREKKKASKMKIRVVARQKTYKFSTGLLMTDEELKYINGIVYGPTKEFKTDRITHEIADEMIKEFKKLYPDFNSATYTVEEIRE